ncbi:MAG TPA: LUD domain-containing protein [Conexibacter sp.]|nr:LUD domain-containing protein [Conexibacter sp.]
MSAARAEILERIRAATRDVPADEPAAWEGASEARAAAGPPNAATLDLLATRIADYRATVTRLAPGADVAAAVGEILARHHARRIVVPAALPPAWQPAGVELIADDPPLPPRALADVDGALTGCTLAIAETGTFVLDGGPGQGRRALTLLPDLHICIVRADQVVASVPEAIARLGGSTRPITLVSGPSATSDIELERVEGVHGPRRLEVVLLGTQELPSLQPPQ